VGASSVKLLLDENLSHRLVPGLQSAYPGSSQVALLGLSGAHDDRVWRCAREQGFVLVTKDDDFLDLAAHHGPPPVVIWLQLGNCSNAKVLSLLQDQRDVIERAVETGGVGVIELS
jgi:predicted nuclease of predicted toxin-antitoxin system